MKFYKDNNFKTSINATPHSACVTSLSESRVCMSLMEERGESYD